MKKTLLKKDGVQKLLASLLSVVIGLVVGARGLGLLVLEHLVAGDIAMLQQVYLCVIHKCEVYQAMLQNARQEAIVFLLVELLILSQ